MGLLSALGLRGVATAQNLPTRADYTAWLAKYAQAAPSFKPGEVLTRKDLERIRPFVPPGYVEQLDFPDVRMEIGAPQEPSSGCFSPPFDHTQRVWKVFQFTDVWSEDLKEPALQKIDRGIRASHLQGTVALDLRNRRATLFSTYGGGFPEVTAQHVISMFDPNSLEQSHR